MNTQLYLSNITAASFAVFLHNSEIAEGEAHPDTLEFLKSRLHLLFGQSVELNPNSDLDELEEIVAHLLAVDLFLANRKELESFQFAEKVGSCIHSFIAEAKSIVKESQSFMPALDIISASKPLFIMINKLLESAANKLITGKITAQELKQIVGITGLISNALHDQSFEYLEAPISHNI
mgnify:CR=1 FL=1